MQRSSNRRAMRTAIESVEPRYLMAAGKEFIALSNVATNGTTDPALGAISFYDTTDVRTATATDNPFNSQVGANTVTAPLFSIWVGYEITSAGGSSRDYEENTPLAIAPGGRTGYMLSFDTGTPGVTNVAGDTGGDYDLYRFNIEAAYNDFVTNHRARGVLYAPRYSPDYNASDPGTTGIDYIATYGGTLGPTGLPSTDSSDAGIPQLRTNPSVILRSNKDADPSNDIVFLDGVTAKVGEVARVQQAGSVFFNQQDIQVVSDSKIVLMENSKIAANISGAVSDDLSIRTLERVSTSPGAAVSRANNTGGFNAQTTESWESFAFTGDNYVQMDPSQDGGVTFPISDVDGMRYVDRDGVQGVWVSDRDGGGDDFSFFKLDLVNHVAQKQEFKEGVAPYPKGFSLDEDPSVSTSTNDGDLDGFDLDANQNLVIRESDFTSVPANEPRIFTHAITNYNVGDTDSPANGITEVQQGGWSVKARLSLAGQPDDDADVTNGLYGVYDAAQDLMYYFDIDTGNAPDVYVYDMQTQSVIFSKLNIDNVFLQDGNAIRAFTLTTADTTAPTVALSYANQTEQAVTLQFSEDVAASFAAGDLVLTNTTTGTVIPTADLTLVSQGSNKYKLTYKAGAAANPLPKGKYTLAVTGAGVTDAAGNPLAGTPSITFNVLPGDANGDNVVNFSDLVILAQHYNQSGNTLSAGNFNYDGGGLVDFADLVILAQNYNGTLPALTFDRAGHMVLPTDATPAPAPTPVAPTKISVLASPIGEATKTSKGRIATQVL